ncbi:unnamed protein product [Paramecium sonneborni]|uniref:Uncharacterized protein n=1 Tax=Paramecium sonneborni TaxID=65129 RepID=A0A8S1RT73_9CILI|nr:unnamed protein product [Paramecium sonneborni]
MKNQIYILWEFYQSYSFFLQSIHLMEKVIIQYFSKHQREMDGQTMNSLEISLDQDRPSLIEIMEDQLLDYYTIFNGLSEIDKFTFDFALEFNNAEKLEDKICVKYEVNRVIEKYKKIIQDENYKKRFNYMKQIIEQNLQNRKDDDEEPQQFG